MKRHDLYVMRVIVLRAYQMMTEVIDDVRKIMVLHEIQEQMVLCEDFEYYVMRSTLLREELIPT